MNKTQVILFITDSTRFDMLGCYGNLDMKTPNLDALAEDGILFEKAYSCQPVCGPSRSSILTGLYPHSNGVLANGLSLYSNVKTIGKRLAEYGITTGYIGKYHLDGGDYFGTGISPDGWDKNTWYDMRCYLEELSPEDRERSRRYNATEAPNEEFTFAHKVCERASKFIIEHQDDNFFLTVSLDEPHDPSLCPEPFFSMYKNYVFPKKSNIWDDLSEKPEYQQVWSKENIDIDKDALQLKWPEFFGCNSFADYEIGKVLYTISEYTNDAMIIYTSDHGESFFSHCLQSKGPAAYDEIARVPFIIRVPNCKGRISHPVSHINIVPTILDYFKLPIPLVLEGKSLLPALSNPNLDINEQVFIEFTRYEQGHDGFGGFRPMRCIFDGRYKLSIHLLDKMDELYDTLLDPDEMHNLIHSKEHYEIAKGLHEKILAFMNETSDPFRGYDWEHRPFRLNDIPPKDWEFTGFTRYHHPENGVPQELDYQTGLPIINRVRKRRTI